MHRETLLDYCLAKPDATRDETPRGHHAEVKVRQQTFAIFGPEVGTVSLKCGQDGEESQVWRDTYPDDVMIMPYLGHYGWNTFSLNGDIEDEDFYRAVDGSYDDVIARDQLTTPEA